MTSSLTLNGSLQILQQDSCWWLEFYTDHAIIMNIHEIELPNGLRLPLPTDETVRLVESSLSHSSL